MASDTIEDLRRRNRELQELLDEAQETLRALASGEVDAVVVSGADGDQVYTLRGADQAYRVMVEGMAEGALTLTAGGLILFANKQFATIVRSPLERVMGARFQDFVAPEDAGVVATLLGATTSRKAEVRLMTPGANLVPVYLSVETLVLDGASCLCIMVTDLSEQKRNEELGAIMEAVPVVVAIARDAECRNIVGNRMAYKLLGIPYASNFSKTAPEDEKPKSWQEMRDGRKIPPEDLPMQKAARTGQPVYDYGFDLVFDDGSAQSWLGNAVPLFDESGRSRGAVGAFVEISEHKRTEEQLRQSQKLESVGLLAGGIAHDFNNLLTGILGNASMVLDEIDPAPAERIKEVIKCAERAANLTRQLLAYSGKGQFVVRDLDVSQAVNEMSDLVQFSVPKSVGLKLDLEKRLPTVRMDPSQLQQILMNLVINAGEAIGEGNTGRIAVSTGMSDLDGSFVDALGQDIAPGRYVSIEVSDTGSGIDESLAPRIFDPFFSTKFVGRGLGLAAVAGIVRSQKGAILVRTRPGSGSTFRVLFPTAEIRELQRTQLPDANERGTVLVVDDEPAVRQFIAVVLSRQGYRVLEASDGREALAVCDREARPIDVTVLDVVMPLMGANELLPLLKVRRPDMGVLLTSGYSESEARRLCTDYPEVAFIQKPYTAQQIARTVGELIGARKQ
jgi:signal transduction histidine kinase/CheY-like chemotaxis protein